MFNFLRTKLFRCTNQKMFVLPNICDNFLKPVLRIRTDFNADPDPGFRMTKNWGEITDEKKYFLIKNCNLLIPRHPEFREIPATKLLCYCCCALTLFFNSRGNYLNVAKNNSGIARRKIFILPKPLR